MKKKNLIVKPKSVKELSVFLAYTEKMRNYEINIPGIMLVLPAFFSVNKSMVSFLVNLPTNGYN